LKQANKQSNKASEELRSCEDQWLVETNQPTATATATARIMCLQLKPTSNQPTNQPTNQLPNQQTSTTAGIM
jgi:hypothetical protein